MVERLLTESEVAELLGLSPATLSTWRSRQRYPLRFIRCGRAIRYHRRDVEAFLAARTVSGDGSPTMPGR
jgi:excisionase family DNA binding protein